MRELRWSWWGTLVLGSVLMLTAGGCRYAEDVLERQEPRVDPRQVFPAFSLTSDDGSGRDIGPWSFPLCEGWEGTGVDRLRLGGLFTAELPPEKGWVQAGSSQAVILVHYPSGSSLASAYLYAEKIDSKGLGAGLRTFLQRVDRRVDLTGLPDLFRFPALDRAEGGQAKVRTTKVPAEPSGDLSGDPQAVPSEEEPSVTQDVPDAPAEAPFGENTTADSTMASPEPVEGTSRGKASLEALKTLQPGYTSEPGSFSGWKWLGTCAPPQAPSEAVTDPSPPEDVSADGAMKPFLRFSRSVGEWRLQPGAEPKPAFQVLATVTLPDRRNYGVHLAIVCTALPQCSEAPTLARLLGSIRVSPGAGTEGDGRGGESLRELTEEMGILVPESP